MNQITIRHHDSISDVEEVEWDGLSHRSKFTSYAWLQTVSQFSNEQVDLQLLLAYAENKLRGAMILEMVRDKDRQNGVARAVLGGNRIILGAFGNHFVPNLAAGVPHGYGGHLLFADAGDPELNVEIAHHLIDAAEELSESLRAPLWFLGALATDKLLLATLQQKGYLLSRYLPLAELPIQWKSFDEYLTWQKRRSRSVSKDIRRERNRCRASGVTFDGPTDISNLDGVFIDLANQVYQKHGSVKFPFERGFFTSLRQRLGNSFMLHTACKNGEVIGFVTMLSDRETAWADSYGLDYRQADNAFVYFNLVHHWPVQKAIELGLKRIVFGRGQYELKLRRGCTLTDTYLLYKPSHWIARKLFTGFFKVVDKHYSMETTSVSND